MTPLSQKIESLLFYRNQPTSRNWMLKTLEIESKDFDEAIRILSDSYEGRGFQMIVHEGEYSLVTHSNCSEFISDLQGDQKSSDLSKQALETLTVVLYNPGITKSEVDYIRGVNSVFILRNLLVRGLVQKQKNEQDKRSPRYSVTMDTLSFLGIKSKEELPNYAKHLDNFSRIHSQWEEESLSEKNEVPKGKEVDQDEVSSSDSEKKDVEQSNTNHG